MVQPAVLRTASSLRAFSAPADLQQLFEVDKKYLKTTAE